VVRKEPILDSPLLRVEPIFKRILNVQRISPRCFVVDHSSWPYNPAHVGEHALGLVGRSFEIVEKDLAFDVKLGFECAGVVPFVID